MDEKQKKKHEAAKAKRVAKTKQERKHVLSKKSGFYLQEAYRGLRTNVDFALANTEGCKVVMVTSSVQSEGKSITALNLAITFGQTEKKVLLIDADMRRPKLARLMNLNAPAGLSNLLMNLNQFESAIVKSKEHNIDMILAGDIPPNPAELLASQRMKKMMTMLRERYDIVIIDSPPVDLVVDAVALSSQCDGVLYVVRAGQTERGAVLHGMEQLEYAGANVLGFVFNGATSETVRGYGKYRYRKYAHYGRYGKYGKYGKYNRYNYYRYGYHGYGYGGYGYHSLHHDAPYKIEHIEERE